MKLAAFLLSFIGVVLSQENPQISTNNILMPIVVDPIQKGIQLRVTAYNGCYSWTSSQPAILSIVEVQSQNCKESSVLVKAQTQVEFNQFIWLIAKHQETKQEMKIEATVGKINRIEIVTKQRTIELDSVEELQIRGFDVEGNTFSTLEGVRFIWYSDQKDIIEIVPLLNSNLQVSEVRRLVEQSGKHSDVMLVKGLKVGKSRITAILKESHYSEIKAEVDLNVIEKFTLIPNLPVFYLPSYSLVNFTIFLIKANQLENIQLPSKYYHWQTSSKISKVEDSGILETKNIESQQTLNIRNTTDNQLNVIYHVVDPKHLGLDIIDIEKRLSREQQYFQSNFYYTVTALVVGKWYYLEGLLFLNNETRIYSQEKVKYEIGNYDLSDLIQGDKIKSDIVRSNVRINLSYKESLKGYQIIQFVKQIEIITPYEYIHLPQGENYELRLQQGSGEYQFEIEHQFIVDVNSQNNIHILKAINLGQTKLRIFDKWNPYNYIDIIVYVTELETFQSLEKKKELIVNQYAYSYYIGQGYIKGQLKNYTQCHSIKFQNNQIRQIEYTQSLKDMNLDLQSLISNSNYLFNKLLQRNSIPIEYDTFGVCSAIYFHPEKIGEYSLTITNKNIHSLMDVRVYEQIEMLESNVLLTPYSIYDINIKGGPRDWEAFVKESTNLIQIHQTKFQIQCKQLGQKFNLQRWNVPTLSLPGPLNMSAILNIECSLPDHFQIHNKESKDPQSTITWIYHEQTIPVLITAHSINKRQFSNFTSLLLKPSVISPLKFENYKLTALKTGENKGILTIKTNSYVNSHEQFTLIQSDFQISVYQPIRIVPGQAILLQNTVKEFKILDGSGDYSCQYGNEQITCTESRLFIHAMQLGEQFIKVQDQKLKSETEALVQVVIPDSIRLILNSQYTIIGKKVIGKVELMYNSKILTDLDQNEIEIISDPKLEMIKSVNQYELISRIIGTHQLRAKYKNLYSDFQSLHVLDKLTSNPPELYLPFDCQGFSELYRYDQLKYQVTPLSNINLEIIQNYLLVNTTTRSGIYNAQIQLLYNDFEIDSVNIPIKVSSLTNVKILYGDRDIDLGSTIRVVAAPFIDNHHISLCICPFLFKWKIGQIIQHSSQNLYGITIKGEQEGEINIELQVDGTHTKSLLNIRNANQLQRNLYIYKQVNWQGSLLLPPKSTYQFDTRIDIIDCNQIGIKKDENSNRIYALSKSIQPTIIKYQQQFISFEVEDAYQIFIYNDTLNLRANQQLKIESSLLNKQGRMFETVIENKVKVITKTPLLIDIKESGTDFQIQALNKLSGKGLIKIQYIDNPQIIDYIQFRVGAFITPNNIEIYLGSTVEFNVADAKQGEWHSTCGNFKKNQLTPNREGNCEITYTEMGYNTPANIKVIRPFKINALSKRLGDKIKISLQLLPEPTTKEVKQKLNIELNCQIQNSDWFKISTINSEEQYCLIEQNQPKQANSLLSKRVNVAVQIKNTLYTLSETVSEEFERDVLNGKVIVELNPSKQIEIIDIPYYERVDFVKDPSVYHFVSVNYDEDKRIIQVKIDASTQIQDEFEGYVWFIQKDGQKLENRSIYIRYSMYQSGWNTQDVALLCSALALFITLLYNYLQN